MSETPNAVGIKNETTKDHVKIITEADLPKPRSVIYEFEKKDWTIQYCATFNWFNNAFQNCDSTPELAIKRIFERDKLEISILQADEYLLSKALMQEWIKNNTDKYNSKREQQAHENERRQIQANNERRKKAAQEEIRRALANEKIIEAAKRKYNWVKK